VKRRVVLIVSLVMLVGSAVLATLYRTSAKPRLTARPVHAQIPRRPKVEVVGAPVYDFGKMSQMQKDSHTWEVKNVGDVDLELWLEESTASANLVLAKPGTKQRVRLKPNETTPVTIQWNTKRFVSWYSQGCTIGTNDPTTPIFMLTVKGTVDSAEPK
jgi:hypothetical protein